MSELFHHKTIITLLGTLGFVVGCTTPGTDPSGTGGALIGIGGEGPATGGATSTGGTTSTGGSTGCESAALPPKTVLCAGVYSEGTVVGESFGHLMAVSAWNACLSDPYGYYPEYPYPSTGGAAGNTPQATGGTTGDDIGMGGSPEATGGIGEGGVGGIGTGGASTGGSTGGGEVLSDWCDSLSPNASIAGISFATGSCRETELKVPLTFVEPNGFYHLKVFAGSSECERGTLLTEMEGYGTGSLIALPFSVPEGFVSLEFTADSWSELSLQLNSLDTPTPLPRE